jgi:hypothetical protein
MPCFAIGECTLGSTVNFSNTLHINRPLVLEADLSGEKFGYGELFAVGRVGVSVPDLTFPSQDAPLREGNGRFVDFALPMQFVTDVLFFRTADESLAGQLEARGTGEFFVNAGVGGFATAGQFFDTPGLVTVNTLSSGPGAPIPEPSTCILCALGVAVMLSGRRRKRDFPVEVSSPRPEQRES